MTTSIRCARGEVNRCIITMAKDYAYEVAKCRVEYENACARVERAKNGTGWCAKPVKVSWYKARRWLAKKKYKWALDAQAKH